MHEQRMEIFNSYVVHRVTKSYKISYFCRQNAVVSSNGSVSAQHYHIMTHHSQDATSEHHEDRQQFTQPITAMQWKTKTLHDLEAKRGFHPRDQCIQCSLLPADHGLGIATVNNVKDAKRRTELRTHQQCVKDNK